MKDGLFSSPRWWLAAGSHCSAEMVAQRGILSRASSRRRPESSQWRKTPPRVRCCFFTRYGAGKNTTVCLQEESLCPSDAAQDILTGLDLEDPTVFKHFFFSFVLAQLKRRLNPGAVIWLRRRRLARSLSFNILLDDVRPSDTARSLHSGALRLVRTACCRGCFSFFFICFSVMMLFSSVRSSFRQRRTRTWPTSSSRRNSIFWVEFLQYFLFVPWT